MSDRDILKQRLQLTRPDYVVYIPSSWDDSADDRGNEHFLVFDGPDNSLMAVWTQAWESPKLIAGPKDRADPLHMASWAFPMVSSSGRVYVLYNQNQGVKGWILFHTGTMSGVYSDDGGATWSEPQPTPMPHSPYDDPEGKIPPEWIVWQRPMRDLSGGYFVGYSHWLHPAVAHLKQVKDWTEIESVVEFMRFENLDDDPEPRDIQIRYTAWGDEALRVPHRDNPYLSVAQEPSLVRLPDQSIFCVMRTCTGYIWWSQSLDDGESWCSPRPLLHRDFGLPLMNPVGPDPIYQLSDGRYILFYHNNRGGRVVDGIQYSLDDPKSGSLSMYSSFTNRNGNDVLWYPDSKFFLLGKQITAEFLSEMKIPKK